MKKQIQSVEKLGCLVNKNITSSKTNMPANWHGRRIRRGARFKGVSDMKASSFATNLEESIPKFKELWDIEDIYREEDRSFSAHSFVAFLRDFIQFEYPQISSEELAQIAESIEQVFIEDPDSHWSDGPTLKDALITNFLSIAPEPAVGGLSIKGYLGPISQSLWDRCP